MANLTLKFMKSFIIFSKTELNIDSFIQGPPGMTVRGPPGPTGSPGLGWLDTSFSPSGSCGCNESLLRLYVKDTNPKLIPGPIGPPGPAGSEGPSGLPVRKYSY